MKRTLALILSALLVLAIMPTLASAQADTEHDLRLLFADCDYIEYGGMVTAGADSFWFTSTQANAAAGLSYDGAADTPDAFPPKDVVVGLNADGSLKKQMRRVKRAVLFGLDAFGAQVWQNGASAPSGGTADGTCYQWPEAAGSGEFFLIADFPDSIQTAGVAVADSVELWVGY